MPGRTTRKDDELHLRWLAMKGRGYNADQIARLEGVTDTRVRVALGRVEKEYLASTAGLKMSSGCAGSVAYREQ